MSSPRLRHHAVSRALRLPPATTGYRVKRAVRVPMRDGVELLADHYVPDTAAPLGTILVRCPYGRSLPFSFIYAAIYAARGYHVLFQSVRGTFGSGGVFVPMVHEAEDAADTVAWLRDQPWFTGSFGTIGLSYLGFTQWALMSDPPPELAAAVIAVGPHDLQQTSWGTGAFALNDFLGWADMMAHQEQGLLPRLSHQINATKRTTRGALELPLGEGGRKLFGQRSPWYASWLEHPDPDDPFWGPMRMTAALDRCAVPVLLLSGWQDVFLNQTIDQYRHLRDRGVEVAMTIGPWTHDEMVTKATGVAAAETLAWMDSHLSGHRRPPRSEPVRVCVPGRTSSHWETLDDWPPPTREAVLYLQPEGGLDAEPPATQGVSTFRYDPADPTPSVGGRLLSRQAGYRDDTRLSRRADVLSFTSAPLGHPAVVYGRPVLELDHSCDIGHYDLFVRVSEVDERGRSRNVSDGFLRFTTNPDGPTRLELDNVAHRFDTGTRIRVLIAGGCHPRFSRNLGTGEPAVSGHRMVTSTHTVRLDGVSRLTLPLG